MNIKKVLKTLFFLMVCFFSIGNIGFSQIDSLKKVIQSLPDGKKKADAYADLAFAYYSISPDSCIKYADILYLYAKKIKYHKQVTGGLYYKGVGYYVKGDYENALAIFKEAIEQSKDIKDEETRLVNNTSVYNLMANIYINTSAYEDALVVYFENLKINEKYNDTSGLAVAHHGIGNVFLSTLDHEKAKIHFEKSIAYFKILNDTENVASSYNSLSIVAQKIDTTRELEYLNIALKYALKKEFSYYIGAIYDNFAAYYHDQNHLKKAVSYSLKSLRHSIQIGDTLNYARTSVNLGSWYAGLNQHDSAVFYLENGIKILEKNNFSKKIGESYIFYAEALSKNNQYQKAYEYMIKAHEHFDSTYTNKLGEQIQESAAKYEHEKNQRTIAEQNLKISKAANTRNLIIFLALLVIALIAGAYQWYLYRQRQKAQANKTALAQQQSEAKRLRELDELKSNFFTNLSHELRTPLTLILSPVADAIETARSNPLKHKLKIVQSNAQKLLNLVNEIMDLSKAEVGQLHVNTANVVFVPFVKRLFSAFESLAEIRKIDFQLDIDTIEEGLIAKIDLEKFEKIINNLLANALKYTRAGGIVQMKVIQINHQFHFEVMDTGKGIHPDDQPHIFNRFYQAKQDSEPLQGGTGVGLALSKELAKLLGGDITFQSELGKGSTFTFSLPLEIVENPTTVVEVEKQEQANPTPFVPTYQPIAINGEKPRLLIVEDNLEMSKYLVEILSNDYQCATASDGQEALKQLKLYQFDCITSDVMMPNMDGFELRQQINQNKDWKQIPFLLLTARYLESDKLKGFQLGIDDYITKPFSTKELQARIHNLISNKIERDNFTQNEPKLEKPADPRKSVEQDLLQTCEKVILENLDNPNFKVETLAKAVNYSQKNLGRLIKKLTGLTPVKFILEVRLQKARELLEKGLVATVIEAQMEVGIGSTSYFTKKFTERFGKNPKEIRG